MSKRVANTKATTARNGRVRLGWHKKRMLSQLEKMEEAARMGQLEEEVEQKFEAFKEQARKILPKRFQPRSLLRRSQNR